MGSGVIRPFVSVNLLIQPLPVSGLICIHQRSIQVIVKKPSKTAQLGAAHRAYHFEHANPVILEESEAGWLVGPPLNAILRYRPLRRLLFERLLARVRPVSTFVVVRR